MPQPFSAAFIILTISGFAAAVIVLVEALSRIRDRFVELGWVSPKGLFGTMFYRKRRADIYNVLLEIGFTGDHFLALRSSMRRVPRTQRTSSDASRIDKRLIDALRPWVKHVPEGYYRSGATHQYYVDTMGAMYHSGSYGDRLSILLAEWIDKLQSHDIIPHFDVILANKDGNSKIIDEVCELISPGRVVSPVVCKGDRSPSRIGVGGSITIVDFEGLKAFLEKNEERASRAQSDPSWRFKVIAADDNCTSGRSMVSAISRFNQLIAQEKLPFEPIVHAVTLFTVKSPDAQQSFTSKAVALHAIVSLGDAEMEAIMSQKADSLLKKGRGFKDGYGCSSSSCMANHSTSFR